MSKKKTTVKSEPVVNSTEEKQVEQTTITNVTETPVIEEAVEKSTVGPIDTNVSDLTQETAPAAAEPVNEDTITPVFPTEEIVTPAPALPKVDENVTVVKTETVIINKEIKEPKKEVEPNRPVVQENIVIPVKIKNGGLLVFDGFMKMENIIKTLNKSETSQIIVKTKGIVDIIQASMKISPDRIIIKK